MSLEQFFAEHWEASPRLRRAAVPSAHELFDLETLEALVAGASAGASSWLNIVDGLARPVPGPEGSAASLAAIGRSYHAGSSLLLIDLQRRWPPVARLCRALEAELLEAGLSLHQRIGANAYLTPAGAQAFDIHYDDHCVVVLQVHGRKHWQVFAPKEELPVQRCEQVIARESLDAPLLDTELEAGDLLYVPRGFPHAARTSDQSSLHVTLSLHALTWLQLLQQALASDASLRRSVPRTTRPDAVQLEYETCVRAMGAVTGLDALVAQRRSELISALAPLPRSRLRELDHVAELTAMTRLRRVPGAICASTLEQGQAVLRFPGSALRLHAAMHGVFSFIAAHREFAPAELPQTTAAFDALGLAKILLREGLVEVAPEASLPSLASLPSTSDGHGWKG